MAAPAWATARGDASAALAERRAGDDEQHLNPYIAVTIKTSLCHTNRTEYMVHTCVGVTSPPQ